MRRRSFIKSGALFLPTILVPRFVKGQAFTLNDPALSLAAPASGGGGGGGYALQFHTAKGAATTDAVDSAGAKLIVVALSYYNDPGINPLIDNKLNTYTALTAYTTPGPNTYWIQLFYCANPTGTGLGHTWTTTGNFPVMSVFGFSGVASPAQDGTETGAHDVQAGSITPSTAADVFIAAVTEGSDSPAISVGSSFVSPDGTIQCGSSAMYQRAAYKIKTDSSAENPTWSPNNNVSAVTLAAFK